MKLIQLTTFSHNRTGGITTDGTPIWINPEHITTLEARNSQVVTDANVSKPVKDRETEDFTLIWFSTGGEDASQRVKETIPEIIAKVGAL